MPYFKDPSNALHFLSTEDVANGGGGFLPAGCVSITDAEAAVIQAPTLAQAKASKLVSLMVSRDAASSANITVQGKTFSAAPEIQTGIKRLADRMRRGKPTTLQAILDVAGNPVSPVPQALLDGIEDAIAANTEAAWNNYGAKVAQVNAAATVAQVNSVTW